jgi:hypothetical protein
VNGAPLGCPNAGDDMTFDFARLIAHAARTRTLSAGTIIGSGTVSNRDAAGGPGRPVSQGGRGYSCIAEQRVVEHHRRVFANGEPRSVSKGVSTRANPATSSASKCLIGTDAPSSARSSKGSSTLTRRLKRFALRENNESRRAR